jgi:hypothetical protein
VIEALFTSGGIVALIIALTLAEIAGLYALHRKGRGLRPADFLPNILAGDFLLLAWLFNTQNATWPWIAIFLLGALASHAADMIRRWRRR